MNIVKFLFFIVSRDCSLYYIATNVIDSGKSVVFSSDLGGYPNPVVVDLGLKDWKKVTVCTVHNHKVF